MDISVNLTRDRTGQNTDKLQNKAVAQTLQATVSLLNLNIPDRTTTTKSCLEGLEEKTASL